MGGRGSEKGFASGGGSSVAAVTKQATALANAPASNILSGKTGSEKQKAYAESLLGRMQNTIRNDIKTRRQDTSSITNKIKEAQSSPSEMIKRIKTKNAKADMQKTIKESNQTIKGRISKIRRAKKATTYGEAITALSY